MKKRMIKAFIFDIGGTLVKTDEALLKAITLALKENGIKIKNKEKVKNVFGKSNYINISTAVSTSYEEIDIDQKIEKCYKSFKMIFPKKVIPYFRIFQGVVKNLKFLQDKGIKLGIFTGFDKDEAMFFLKKMKLIKFFNVIVTVDDVKKPRPHPKGILDEIKKLGIKKEECIYVGDGISDIQMAKNAGVKIACVKTGVQKNKLLEKEKPDYFVKDIPYMIKKLGSLISLNKNS